MINLNFCPCKSGKKYTLCCSPLIKGVAVANSAEQLMRSRYTAFVIENVEYLLGSWHKDYKPALFSLDHAIKWVHLEIIESKLEKVHFCAFSLFNNRIQVLEEKSNFIKIDLQWFYTDGELMPTNEYKISRNSACLCGSGKKFKRCCYPYY